MASKYIIVVKDGVIKQHSITPPQAPRKQLVAWLGRCVEAARRAGVDRYAFRHAERWYVYAKLSSGVWAAARSFPTEDGAAMWLLHRSAT